jgi:hypothetical protein
MMYSCNVIYRHGQLMCGSVGSTKRQAERNAAVMGVLWIEKNKDELKAFRKRKEIRNYGKENAC